MGQGTNICDGLSQNLSGEGEAELVSSNLEELAVPFMVFYPLGMAVYA